MGAVPATAKHDVQGDAVAIVAVDVGTTRVPRAGPGQEIGAPQSDPELALRVGLTGKG